LALFALGANTVIYFSTGASLGTSLFGAAPSNARTCASVNHVSAQR
jgi:hypothetical protein